MFVEQVTCELSTGTRIAIGWNAVAFENPPDPDAGPKHHDEDYDNADNEDH